MSTVDPSSTDSEVVGLGYLGFGGDDLEAWRDFGVDVLGFGLAEATDDLLRFRIDGRVGRLMVHRGEAPFAYVGWEVTDDAALDRVVARLASAGLAVAELDAATVAARGVARAVRTADPDGHPVELFCTPTVREVAAVGSPYGTRFVTGDQGLGHFVQASPSSRQCVEFYTGLLGFATTDVMTEPVPVSFLGCNPRHHSVAIAGPPVPTPMLHHFMVEVDDLRAVGQAYDRVLDRGLPVTMTLGQHWNDHMISFYVQSPSGFSVELGYGGRRIDRSTWTTVTGAGEMSFWGHRMETAHG